MTYGSRDSRHRDTQDHVERGMWGTLEYVAGAGASMTVRGTGTTDFEVPLLNIGYSFNLPQNSNAEMVMLSLGSDVNDKVVLATLPRDLQHPWAEGTGGVQNPTDPNKRIEFNGDEIWLKDGNFKLGDAKEVEVTVAGGAITINVNGTTTIISSGDLDIQAPNVEITSGSLTHNGVNVGDTHRHGGVVTGGANTGGPN